MAFESTGWQCSHDRTPENTLSKPYRRQSGIVVRYEQCRTCHNQRSNQWHHRNKDQENYKRKLRWVGVDLPRSEVYLTTVNDRRTDHD